jgi:microcystin-dependent protein
LGGAGGAETVTLSNSQLPNLSVTIGNAFSSTVRTSGGSPHGVTGAGVDASQNTGCQCAPNIVDVYEPTTLSSSTGGGGGAHQNTQPTAIVLTCIKT